MKGFIKILEAVIASIIILASLTYFFSAPAKYKYWGETFSRIQTQDALASLYKSDLLTEYVQNNDVDGLNNTLTAMLPESLDFSVEIIGIPNPIIYIGCDCSDAEITELENMLIPLRFVYENRQIEIRIKKESIDNIDPRTNIHFMFGYTNLNPHKEKVEEFLLDGGTMFMFSNLSKDHVEDGVLNETFGLEWKGTAGSSTGKFYKSDDVSKVSHRIEDYFLNIGGDADEFAFTFNPATENKIDYDEKTIIRDSNDRISHVKVNELTRGRTVWFADYNHADEGVNNLTKAVVLWASGERYRMDPAYKDSMIERLKTIKIPYTEASYLIPNYEVRLKSWSVFY